jgi:hypothetical protein
MPGTFGNFRYLACIYKPRVATTMLEPRTTAVAAVQTESQRTWVLTMAQTSSEVLGRAAGWAGDTAQQFGVLLSVLMGPAVFSAYAFALWSLASNLGWTDTFVFISGPLSNWLIWAGIAVLVNVAASILKRHTHIEKTS